MDTITIQQGETVVFTAGLADASGPWTGYDGTESIVPTLWADDGQAAIPVAASAVWDDPDFGTVTVTLTAPVDLAPAVYTFKLAIEGTTVWKCWADVLAAPGSVEARTAHVTMADLKVKAPWVEKLLRNTADPTALEARADAWDWFCDLLHRHYRGQTGIATDFRFIPGYSFGGCQIRRDGRRNRDLQGWLDAGRLDLTGTVRDAMVFQALGTICNQQITPGVNNDYATFARSYFDQAEFTALGIVAELDSDGDGVNDVAINLGVADTIES